MFIRAIDEGMERLIRTGLNLPPETMDVSFAVPDAAWASRLSRVTLSLFLYEIKPSNRPAQSVVRRVDADGRVQTRPPSQMLEMNYLISAWADNPLVEHQLLGEVINHLVAHPTIPLEYLPTEPTSAVFLTFGADGENKLREVWRAAGGHLKASFSMSVVAAADSFPWSDQAPPVAQVVSGIARRP